MAGCSVCGKIDAGLQKCGRCTTRLYCGSECQKSDWPTHKIECKRQNYVLKIDLLPRFITNPRITRTISCPATATFDALHEALQVAFSWAHTHLYDFEVFDHSDLRGREHRLTAWVPLFKITDPSTEDGYSSGPPSRDSNKITLFKILDDPKTKGKTIHYSYDFGDGWEHVISCTGRSDPTTHFVCLEGEGHGCAEDVGGYSGWNKLLKAYDSQNPTKNQKELMTWFEETASNKDPGGLRGEKKWKWDKERINAILKEFDGPSVSVTGSSTGCAILLISLEKQPFFDKMYAEVMISLRSKATVVETTDIASAMHHLEKAKKDYSAVIITDPGVMEKEFTAAQNKIVNYAHDGGTVVIGFHFSSFAQFDDVDLFFKEQWHIGWKVGSYTRTTFSLNPRVNPNFKARQLPSLPSEYSMKALHIRHTKLADRVYITSPTDADSPAVFSKYGSGYLGWIGDVNTETATTDLLLSMCGA